MKRFFYIGLLALALGNVGCEGKSAPAVFHSISDIRKSPTEWEGRDVRFRGSVKGLIAVPFSDLTAYEFADDTGQVYVLTKKALPAVNEKLVVLGKAKNMLIVGVFSTGLVIIESQRM